MSTTPQNTDLDKEIDFRHISQKAGNLYNSFWNTIIGFTFFLRRNIIIISVLFIVGFALGMFMDRGTKSYDHQIVVIPNFGSVDYVYDKVAFLESKIKSNDTLFLSQLGIKNADDLKKIEVEPINDIYAFINLKQQNFELVKLMAEDGDVTKIIEDPVTSKNYGYHKIMISTSGKNDKEHLIDPILKFLNSSTYYADVQKSVIESIKIKVEANQTTIGLIDSLLNEFSSRVGKNMNDKMVYYNENTQLNDVLRTKNELIYEISAKKIELINSDKIVKDSQVAVNIENTKALYNKMKLVIPILFVGMFIVISWFRKGYLKKRNNYIEQR